MAWDEGQTLTVRFEHACQAAGELHPHWRLGTSYACLLYTSDAADE